MLYRVYTCCLDRLDHQIIIQSSFNRPRHIGPVHGVMIWKQSMISKAFLWFYHTSWFQNLYVNLVIQPVLLPFMSIQWSYSNKIMPTLIPLLFFHMLCRLPPCCVGLLDLFPTEHVWNIIGRQLQSHLNSALIVLHWPTNLNMHRNASYKLISCILHAR